MREAIKRGPTAVKEALIRCFNCALGESKEAVMFWEMTLRVSSPFI